MALITPTFCVEADLTIRFGETALINWADHDEDGVADTSVIEVAINRAHEEIRTRLAYRYTPETLALNAMVKGWCEVLAGYYASTSRGNPAPANLEADRVKTEREMLECWDCQITLGSTAADRARP